MWLFRKRASYFTAIDCTTCPANSRICRSASLREEYKNQRAPPIRARRIIQIASPPSPFRLELRARLMLQPESLRFDNLAVVDQHRLFLQASVSAELVSRIQ